VANKDLSLIRNFSIIAHIDHGKSTLADRLLELTGTVKKREMKSQLLDKMDLEREKGITIKLAPVRMKYETKAKFISNQEDSRSYVMGIDDNYAAKLKDLSSHFEEDGNNYKISVSANNLSRYEELIKEALSPGYWNDIIMPNKVRFIFKDKAGNIKEYDWDKNNENEILSLANSYASASFKDVKSMLEGNSWYADANLDARLDSMNSGLETYQLNLIDTPGHVDFSYEVSRSLQACEGAILVVDATQGIQAQTLANLYLAFEQNLKLIPVLNKIDLPAADVEKVSLEIINLLGCKPEEILKVSAKTGEGVEAVLDAIIEQIPPPDAKLNVAENPTKALIFDSYYDDYRGVVVYVRLFDGKIKNSDEIKMMAESTNGVALEVGHLSPSMIKDESLSSGEIGYIVTNLHSTSEAKVGDTITLNSKPAQTALQGYKDVTPFVYAGFFPASNEDYENLKDAIEKLSLSDSALKFSQENSPVLGFGFRVGFLGLLHLEIVKERLEREYDLEVIVTNPSTDYIIKLNDGSEINIKSASEMPSADQVIAIKEPWINGEIVSPKEYLGGILSLIAAQRGLQKGLSYTESGLAIITFEAPLANMLTDFYDSLKSITSGYGSFNYQIADYREESLVRLDFYVAGEMVDSLSLVVHRSEAPAIGRKIVEKLKSIIPKQLFKVSLQAAINGKFIAREDVSALKKNVTAHLYGGDVSRKKKLWAKQKAGKARMKKFGKVEIPNEAFTVLIKKDD
jgi:GTP-binding protein LepA